MVKKKQAKREKQIQTNTGVKLDEIDVNPERTKAVDELVRILIRGHRPQEALEASMLGASRSSKIGLARFLLEEKKIAEFALLYDSEDLGEAVTEAMALSAFKNKWIEQKEILEKLLDSPSGIFNAMVNDMLIVYIRRGMLEAASTIVRLRSSKNTLSQDELNVLMDVNTKKGDLRACRKIADFQRRNLTTDEIRRIAKAIQSQRSDRFWDFKDE